MKKFLVKTLALLTFLTSFDAQPLVATAAEAATDAYDAYNELMSPRHSPTTVRNNLLQTIRDMQILATDGRIAGYIEQQLGADARVYYESVATSDAMSLQDIIDAVDPLHVDVLNLLVKMRDVYAIELNDVNAYMNERPEYHAFVWGDLSQANALSNFKDGWHLTLTPEQETNYKQGTAPGKVAGKSYSSGGITFEQTNAYGTAQVKAGEWLNETTYDATAGMPTTENLFITVGGTQYIVDVTYEYIARPYVRRYHFDAEAANYRYRNTYGTDPDGRERSMLSYQWKDTTVTNYDWNLATDRHAALRYYMSTHTKTKYYDGTMEEWTADYVTDKNLHTFWYWDDFMVFWMDGSFNPSGRDVQSQETTNSCIDFRPYNTAWINGALGLKVNPDGDNTLTSEEQMQLRRNRGVDYSYTNVQNQWQKAPGFEDKEVVVEPFTHDFVQTLSVENWGVLYYDKGDDASVKSSATHSPGMLAAVLYKTQVAELVKELKAQLAHAEDNYRADEGHYNVENSESIETDTHASVDGKSTFMYTYYGLVRPSAGKLDSNTKNYNVWNPNINSYLLDYNGVDSPGADSKSLTMQKAGTDAVRLVADAILESYTRVYNESPVHLDMQYSKFVNDYSLRQSLLEDINWYGKIGLYDILLDNYCDFMDLSMTAETPDTKFNTAGGYHIDYGHTELSDADAIRDRLMSTWLVYLNDPDELLSTWIPAHSTGLTANELGAEIASIQYAADYNQLAEVYYTAILDLFVSTSGLFYTDEIIELFGDPNDPTTWFPGFNPTLLSGHDEEYNQKVAQNLHDVFGIPIPSNDEGEIPHQFNFDWDSVWSVPWACFPRGGDLDGAMEDDDLGIKHSSDDTAIGDMSPAEYLCPMVMSPQYVDYSTFGIQVELISNSDTYRDQGYDYATDWHDFCTDNTHLHMGFDPVSSRTYPVKSFDYVNNWNETVKYWPSYATDGTVEGLDINGDGIVDHPATSGIPHDACDANTNSTICAEATGPHGCNEPVYTVQISADKIATYGSVYVTCKTRPSANCGNTKGMADCSTLPSRPFWGASTSTAYSCETVCNCSVTDPDKQCSNYSYFAQCSGMAGGAACGPDAGSVASGCTCTPSTASGVGGGVTTICACMTPVTSAQKANGTAVMPYPLVQPCDAGGCSCVSKCQCDTGEFQKEDRDEGEHWHSAAYQPKDEEAGIMDAYDYSDRHKARTHDQRAYKETIQLVGYDIPDMALNLGEMWDNETKDMVYTETLLQAFDDIEYINIMSYSMWAYDSAEVRGLGKLLATYEGIVNLDTEKTDYANDVLVTKFSAGNGYVVYNADDRDLTVDPGVGIEDGQRDFWNTLEMYGRIANSLREDSLGNEDANYNLRINFGDTTVLGYNVKDLTLANIAGDAPWLNYYKTATNSKYTQALRDRTDNFVNGDYQAFRLQDLTGASGTVYIDTHTHPGDTYVPTQYCDDLSFTYDPYTQGGRSHTTFAGFVAQALARSLYYYADVDGSLSDGNLSVATTSEAKKNSYSNSVRIQGDYASMRDLDYRAGNVATADDHTFTVAGQMYDAWSEVDLSGQNTNKFALLNDFVGNNGDAVLARYLSRQSWVPGDMAYILGRKIPTSVLSTVNFDSMTNSFLVHTYVKGTNMDTTSRFDGVYPPGYTLSTVAHEDLSLQGDVNYNRAESKGLGIKYAPCDENNEMPWVNKNGSKVNIYVCRNSHSGVNGADERGTVYGPGNVPLYVGQTIYLDYSGLPDAGRLHDIGQAYSIDASRWNNKNSPMLEARTSGEVPYIGYQSDGDGTSNITRTGDTTTSTDVYGMEKTWQNQAGYNYKDWNSRFTANATMVTDDTLRSYNNDGGFARFGIDLTSDLYKHNFKQNDVAASDMNVRGQEELDAGKTTEGYDIPDAGWGGEGFSGYYPWLANLNLNRYLPNGRYYSCQVYNTYHNIVYEYDGKKQGDTTYNFNRIGENSLDQILRVNARYMYTSRENSHLGIEEGNQYPDVELPNSIVIYNPVTTQSAHIVDNYSSVDADGNKSLGYQPDGYNWGTDDAGNPRYLAGFGDLVRRDLRVGRHMSYGSQGSEDYNISNGVISSVPVEVPGSTHKELRAVFTDTGDLLYYMSQYDTHVYTMDKGYTVDASENETVKDSGSPSSTLSVTESGVYKFQTSASGSTSDIYAFTMNLLSGDELFWAGNTFTLTRTADDYTLSYTALQDAYIAATGMDPDAGRLATADYVPINSGTTMNLITTPISIHSGSTYRIDLELSTADGSDLVDPFDVIVPAGFDKRVTQTGNLFTIWIEANRDNELSNISLRAKDDIRIMRTETSLISYVPSIVMMSSANVYGGLTTTNTAYQLGETPAGQGFYNPYLLADYNETDKFTLPAGAPLAGYMYSLETSKDIEVTYNMNEPHYVPNTNWRYYVLGWKTESGHVIKSVDDPVLAMGSTTVLVPPIGYTGATGETKLTATLFDSWAKDGKLAVGRYSGKFYLFHYTADVAPFYVFPLKLDWYGITVYEWDRINFGEASDMAQGDFVSWGVTSQSAMSVHTKAYSYAFMCGGEYNCIDCLTKDGCPTHGYKGYTGNSGAGQKDVRAFDVKYSANLQHKVATSAPDADYDWIDVADTRTDAEINQYNMLATDFTTLDDEFTIYWDNFIDLSFQTDPDTNAVTGQANRTTEQNLLSSTVGRGWDSATRHSDTDSDDNSNVRGYDGADSLKYNPSGMFQRWHATGGTLNLADSNTYTDTTKWIRNKYVVFNVDMYGFTKGDSFTLSDNYDPTEAHLDPVDYPEFDPTTPAVSVVTHDDGSTSKEYNNVVYIPAGTKVYLGYNVPEINDATGYRRESAVCNDGLFVDYGYNTYNGNTVTTQDPNGDNYVYHFWTPLHVGESDSEVTVEYFVESINDYSSSEDALGARNNVPGDWLTRFVMSPRQYAVKRSNSADEWGNRRTNGLVSTIMDNNRSIYVQVGEVGEDANNADTLTMPEGAVTATSYLKYNDSYKVAAFSTVGRIGSLAVVDTGDPRYQDTFKNPTDGGSTTNPDYIIPPIVHAVREYSNVPTAADGTVTAGSQHMYLADVMNVRGRLSVASGNYTTISDFNTYGSQWYMADSTVRRALPMGADFNIHGTTNMPEQKLGYDMFMSVETIGNYYGSANWRLDSNENPANLNDDYGQTKVQIRPMYIYLEPQRDASGNLTHYEATALDVYYPSHGAYVPLNAGSYFSGERERELFPSYTGDEAGPYWLDVANASYYNTSLDTNSAGQDLVNHTYILDQHMMRISVTEQEARTTYKVVHDGIKNNNVTQAGTNLITTSILDPFELRTAAVEDDGFDYMLDSKYYYGNTQILFLRESNRTFIGGANQQINDNAEGEWVDASAQYSQKWYFTLGLPNNSVFVKHGETNVNKNTIINGDEGYILTVIAEMYAIGEKWILSYNSRLSDGSIILPDGTVVGPDTWKVYPDKYPNMIPISIYNTKTMNDSDLDSRGVY